MLPNDIYNAFQCDFHFPEKMVFCQMATQAQSGPRVRTVRLYSVEDDHGLVFVTHTASRKWHELKHNPKMAVCFLHPDYQIQLRAECRVNLLEYSLAPVLAKKCWEMIADGVKKIYYDDDASTISHENQKLLEVGTIPNRFGLIIAAPHVWEYLAIDADYPNSTRCLYTQDENKNWQKESLAVI